MKERSQEDVEWSRIRMCADDVYVHCDGCVVLDVFIPTLRGPGGEDIKDQDNATTKEDKDTKATRSKRRAGVERG